MESPRDYAVRWIDQNREHLVSVGDSLWEYAEVALQESESSALLMQELDRAGFNVVKGVGGIPTAFSASWGTGVPVIGIMAEYDAVPYVSQNVTTTKEPRVPGGPGHGCGHNICGASGVAAALSIRQAMEAHQIAGTLKVFGCAAEEILVGKVWMAHDGVFNDSDVILGHHPSFMNTAVVSSESAMTSLKFHFRGTMSHASVSPERGRSALDAVEVMNVGVNYLREHMPSDARIHYVIEDGGVGGHIPFPNEVPPYARSWYWIRSPKREQVDEITERVKQIADGADLITGTTHDVEFVTACDDYVPNVTLAKLYVANMREIGAPTYTEKDLAFAQALFDAIPADEKVAAMVVQRMGDQLDSVKERVMDTSIREPWGLGEFGLGSGDVGNVSYITPTLMCSTAAFPIGLPHHSWQVVACAASELGHKSLIFGSKIIACTALDLLLNADLLRNVRREFEERTEGRKYISPLPKGARLNLEQLPPEGRYPVFDADDNRTP
jgi:aminobenzoyl-glutamate utilization protein B